MTKRKRDMYVQGDWSGTGVPETGLKVDYPEMCGMYGQEEIDAILEVLNRPVYLTLSVQTRMFQEEFAAFIGTKYAFACTNAASGLEMAGYLAGVEEEDEVISPPITFASANLGILRLGAKVVFADCHPKTINVTAETIEAKITNKTKAVYVVHLNGLSCDMDPIMELARKHNIKVIEDCAHAPGATYKGRKVGSIGDFGCFSFHTAKNMTTLGEGGMVTLSNDDDAAEFPALRHVGLHPYKGQKEYWIPYMYDIRKVRGRWPYNFCMNEVQAAVGRVQLRRVNELNELRRNVAKRWTEGLKHVEGFQLPPEPGGYKHVYHLYPIQFDGDRDAMIRTLHDKYSIRCVPLYPPVYYFSAYREMGYQRGLCPVAERVYAKLFNLPMNPAHTDDQVDYVIDSVRKAAQELKGTKIVEVPILKD